VAAEAPAVTAGEKKEKKKEKENEKARPRNDRVAMDRAGVRALLHARSTGTFGTWWVVISVPPAGAESSERIR
jgi:hypothetical protein